MLFRKLLRTFLRYKAQFISMIVMIFLGVGIFAGFNAEWYSIEKDCNDFFEKSNLADYRVYITDSMKSAFKGFSEEDLDKILSIDGVTEASRVIEINTTESKENDTVKMCVTSNATVTTPIVIDGKPYDQNSSNGLWISENYADKNNYRIGDEITLSYGKLFNKTFIIEGIALSGEFLINTDGISLMPNYDSIGYCFISPLAYKETIGFEFYTQMNVKTTLDSKEFSQAVDRKLENTFQVLSKEDLPSYSEAYGESDEGKTMGLMLPVIFLLIAVLTMVTTMNRLTQNEKVQIGILKALGFKDRRITWHYTSYALFIGFVSSIIGMALGYGVALFIFSKNGSMGTYFEMPVWTVHMPWFVWLGVVGIVGFLTLIGYLSVRKVLGGTAAEALRPYEPKKMKALAIEKTKTFHKLGFATRWNLRDTFRHISRTLMTIFGVFGCTLLLFASFGMMSTMNGFVDSYYNVSLNYKSKISLADGISKEEAIKLAKQYDADYSSTLAIKIEGNTYTADIFNNSKGKYVILDNNPKKMEQVGKDGIYVCQRLVEKYDLHTGDTLVFSLYGKKEIYKATIIGSIYSLSEGIVMTDSYAESITLPYSIDTIYTDIDKKDITKTDLITNIFTKEDIMNTFDAFLSIMNEMIALLVAFSSLLAFVVLYNLGTMSFTERYRELSTLKVLGFKNNKIRTIMITQTIWLTVLGIAIGVPAGAAVLGLLIKLLAPDYEMKICYKPYVFLVSIVITFAVSVLVSWLVSRKTRRINMVESLKAE